MAEKQKNDELDWFKRFFHYYSTLHKSPENVEYKSGEKGGLLVQPGYKNWECECRVPGVYTGGPSNIYVRMKFLKGDPILSRVYEVCI